MNKISILLILVLNVVWLPGCSVLTRQTHPIENTAYLTPIPEATLLAFNEGAPIQNKLQAAIAARMEARIALIGNTDLSPKIVSVEELTLDEAKKRVGRPPGIMDQREDRPGSTKVWLTIFEGDWQIIPPDPDHTITPEPPIHGCYYVLMDAQKPYISEISRIECPKVPRS